MSAICGLPGLAFELSAQRGILPPHDMAGAVLGDIGLNSTVKVSGILSASIETTFMPPSETLLTEHWWLEIPSPEIQALM